MACVEDCDQILIASTIKDSQGWEENGNSSTVLCWCSFVVYILISESFQNDDDESVDWGGASLGSRERGEWGSWEEGEPHSEASTATVGENVFDIMRDGWVARTNLLCVTSINPVLYKVTEPSGEVYQQVWTGLHNEPEG